MTTTNPTPLAKVPNPDPISFSMDVRDGVAELVILDGPRQLVQVRLPLDEMRRVVYGLQAHLESHMENR